MKKILYFASMMLALGMTYSCAIDDNPVLDGTAITIQDENGNKYETGLVATFKSEVGQEVSLTLGVYDQFDIYGVDFGDGKVVVDTVCYQNNGLLGEDGKTKEGTTHTAATTFKGTVAGKGEIQVYGKSDVWYLNTSGNVIPTSFDQEKLKNVVQMSISGANVESVELPALEKLTSFSFNNSSVKNIDISKATGLTSFSAIYSPTYTGEMNLTAIDLQNNTKLTDLSIQSQSTVPTPLKEIDLSKNVKLTNIYLPNNSLTKVTLPADFTTTDANNPNTLAKVSIFLQNNKLTAIEGLEKLPAKSQANISNNLFTLATLPAKPANVSASKYTYAPQPAYEVPETVTELDLSSQLSATGVLTEPTETTYSFVTAGGTALEAGTDYEVTAPGKFKFLKAQTEKVHGVMATTAFPKFTNKNAYVTTEFTVTVGASTPAEARSWDFTKWSAETVANLKADAAASIFTGWSDVEKDPAKEGNPQEPTEATKDNCFWLAAETTDANGKAIAELAGLQFDKDYCTTRSLAIAVNYPSTSLGTYAGASYLWLGGKGKTCFTIPAVKAGQKITIVAESHKATEGRGVEINGEKFTPTTKDSHTWDITADGDVVVKNTNGCHIYSIEVK